METGRILLQKLKIKFTTNKKTTPLHHQLRNNCFRLSYMSFIFISKSLVSYHRSGFLDNQLLNLSTVNLHAFNARFSPVQIPSALVATLLLQRNLGCKYLLPMVIEMNCYP